MAGTLAMMDTSGSGWREGGREGREGGREGGRMEGGRMEGGRERGRESTVNHKERTLHSSIYNGLWDGYLLHKNQKNNN